MAAEWLTAECKLYIGAPAVAHVLFEVAQNLSIR